MMINRMSPNQNIPYTITQLNPKPPIQTTYNDITDTYTHKRALRPDPNSHQSLQIGSFRFPNQNFEKVEINVANRESLGFSTAIVMDNRFKFMSPTELRVEDYYLMRTCPDNSEFYNFVFRSGRQVVFNN